VAKTTRWIISEIRISISPTSAIAGDIRATLDDSVNVETFNFVDAMDDNPISSVSPTEIDWTVDLHSLCTLGRYFPQI